MKVVHGLKVQSVPQLPSLEYDTVTFRADLKAEYEA